jgi:hypothetical protein
MLLPSPERSTLGNVVVAEPATLAELIQDCAELPASVQHPTAPLAEPVREQVLGDEDTTWQVGEDCAAQVAGIDDYGPG